MVRVLKLRSFTRISFLKLRYTYYYIRKMNVLNALSAMKIYVFKKQNKNVCQRACNRFYLCSNLYRRNKLIWHLVYTRGYCLKHIHRKSRKKNEFSFISYLERLIYSLLVYYTYAVADFKGESTGLRPLKTLYFFFFFC